MAGKVNKVEHKEPARLQPPVFPLGMRFGFARDMCILDFLDQQNNGGGRYCFYSVAITKQHAIEMVNNLTKFIESQGD
ncbi:hypothetical protein GJN70_22700 [Salmonella enterica subsp. enterica serovar Bareilly]|nr:hypothetical protein [Salmonella enterica subsp. enterica serovar Bareilly]EGZ8583766.1 hypothetical protein [Salmonella enterica]